MVTGGRAFNDRATVHATMDKVRVFAADYRERRAPLKRNIRMLEERPDLLSSFPAATARPSPSAMRSSAAFG